MEKNAAPRAINSAVIHVAALQVPVKFYTATVSDDVSFKMLSPTSLLPIKQKLHDPIDDSEVPRDTTLKGYEITKGEFVVFSKEEVAALEAERDKTLKIEEFVPLATVDFIYVEKSYYVGPDKNGDQAFALLMQTLKEAKMVALGKWAARGKEQLVLLRPHGNGMIMHQLYHAGEVRDDTHIGPDKEYKFGPNETGLMGKLVKKMSASSFNPEKFKDDYAERVQAAVQAKRDGTFKTEIPQVKASVIDLAAALSLSLNGLDDVKPKKKAG